MDRKLVGHHIFSAVFIMTFDMEPPQGPLTVKVNGLPRGLDMTCHWPGGFDSSEGANR